MRVTARPRIGGRRAVCNGIVVVLVVADPLWGAGPDPCPTPEGEGGDG